MMVVLVLLGTLVTGCREAQYAPLPPQVIILHTNDLHSHLMGRGPVADYTPGTTGDDKTTGGISRLATRIARERASSEDIPLLLLAAGNFSVGSLFDWITATRAPSLMALHWLKYDAATLGNREFEYAPNGLATALDAAIKAGFQVPLVGSNISFDASSTADDRLQKHQPGVIRRKVVKTFENGLKVGIFGLMGRDAARNAINAAPITFESITVAARSMVKELRQQDGVDLVILLSHSGIDAQGKGQVRDLARQVKGIDVILCGHSHRALASPVMVDQTPILQAGAFGQQLGKLELFMDRAQVSDTNYRLLPVDDDTPGDPKVQQLIDAYIKEVDGALASAGTNLSYRKVIAESTFGLSTPSLQESPLGNLITDAYVKEVARLQLAPPEIGLELNGFIKSDVKRGKTGKLWFADIYRALPLGLTQDGRPGLPLVTFFANGQELKSAMEFVLIAREAYGDENYFVQLSGLKVVINNNGSILDRVQSLMVGDQKVDTSDTKKCYKIVTSSRVISTMKAVTGLTITTKQEDCVTVVNDVHKLRVDRDLQKPGIQELSQWQALVSFLSTLPDSDGDKIPDIPARYEKLQNRIVLK